MKVVTINILYDLSLWEKRRTWLAQSLSDLEPDLVALQEVNLRDGNTAAWLAGELGFPHIFLGRKTGRAAAQEGIAILSRLPFEAQDTLDLKTQQRVAQLVRVQAEKRPLVFANGHFFWQPGESNGRLRQVERLQEWLEEVTERQEQEPAVVVCGDFNGAPETAAVRLMRQRFQSAYAAVHGREPEYTVPTPLPRSKWALLRIGLRFVWNSRPNEIRPNWRSTLDYIFVNQYARVVDCQLALNQPLPGDPRIYPSDHFGLMADLEII